MNEIHRRETAHRANLSGPLRSTLSALFIIASAVVATPGAALAWTGQPLAYVANSGGNTVSVIDTGDNFVVKSIPVGKNPNSVAVSSDGRRVYVSNSGDNTVSVIDASEQTNKVIAKISVASACPLAVAPDGKHVYVVGRGSFCNSPPFDSGPATSQTGEVFVIDTAALSVTATVTIPPVCAGEENVNFSPYSIAVSTDGKTLYTPGYFQIEETFFMQFFVQGAVAVIDPVTHAATMKGITPQLGELDAFPASGAPVAVTADGQHIYVGFTIFNGGITADVYDILSGAIVCDFICGWPEALAVSPDGKTMYISGIGGGFYVTSVFDIATRTVTATIAPNFGSLALTPDGTKLYGANANAVSVINTASNSIVGNPIPAGPGAAAIAIVAPPQSDPPFKTFRVSELDIKLSSGWRADTLELRSEFSLTSADRKGFHPELETVKLQAGPFVGVIPAKSFVRGADGFYTYDGPVEGAVNTLRINAKIRPTGTLRYAFDAAAGGLEMPGITNPVQVSLEIGDYAGLAKHRAHIERISHQAAN
ncbi:YncE family protein [Methylocapsa palsarum]|uniref:40-residue YVTN family beta-propeller repeat-containing protein n=1 Tax=Methylocapsa palsarum TaxID=1612308 RepID=A0A1I4A755_9HYPH|nr:YncE family protein [Methylocapsa palsarum]SFK51947.1 40-residue YVTN family beta-propeller repeat-containing protein [Methylocapsa palsarum]